MPIVNRLADLADEITAWRRDFHENPEILYETVRTSGKVAELLESFGLDEVVTGIGKTGVVGVIKGKNGGYWQDDRTARGHGCASDRGNHRKTLRFESAGQNACVRS
jgi:hypothetical protein